MVHASRPHAYMYMYIRDFLIVKRNSNGLFSTKHATTTHMHESTLYRISRVHTICHSERYIKPYCKHNVGKIKILQFPGKNEEKEKMGNVFYLIMRCDAIHIECRRKTSFYFLLFFGIVENEQTNLRPLTIRIFVIFVFHFQLPNICSDKFDCKIIHK